MEIPSNISTSGFYPRNRSISMETQLQASVESTDKFSSSSTEDTRLIPDPTITQASSGSKTDEAVWIKDQCPARLLKTDPDGTVHMTGVRWGFTEDKDPAKWEPAYKETSVDMSKVKNVYLVTEPFAPEWIAAHGMMYFEFDGNDAVKTSDDKTSNGLVVSVEARLKEGDKYDLIQGMKDKFGIIYQLSTWDDIVQKTCRRQGHRLIRHQLDISDDRKKELLNTCLRESFKDRTGEFYHTTRNSCYSNQVRMLNTVLPKARRIKEWIIPGKLYNPAANMPRSSGAVFEMKGLLADTPRVVTLPDKELFPVTKTEPSSLTGFIRKLTEMSGWRALSGLSGMVAGAALGTLLPGIGTVIGGITGAIAGGFAGVKGSEMLEWGSHYETEPAEKYYTK